METKVIDVETRTIKERFENAKEKAKEKMQKAVAWAVENKELVIASIPIITIGANGIVKFTNSIAKNHNIRKEEEVKTLYVYDRRNGMYLHLRKPLTNSQKAEIDQRKADGESLTQILMSMKMLG